MLAHYETIVSILSHCSTDQVSVAEERIKQLAAEDLQVLSCLRQILQDGSLQNQMYVLATAMMNSLFVENCGQYTQGFCCTFLGALLMDHHVPVKYKKEMLRAIMYTLEQCDTQYLQKWKQFTHSALTNQKMYEVGLLMLNAWTATEIRDNIIEEFDEKPFVYTMELLVKKVDSQERVDYDEILYIFEVWKLVMEYLVHFNRDYCVGLFMKFADSHNFCKALEYAYQTLSTGQGKHYLYLNDSNLDQQKINQIKRSALQLHNIILSHIVAHRTKKLLHTLLYQYTGMNIEVFVNSLCFAAHNRAIRQQIEIDEILINMLQILKSMTDYSPQILCKSWKQMLHFLIFPLLTIDEEELEEFQENTGSYIEISEDICEKQQMGILKTESANFMEKISDSAKHIEISTDEDLDNTQIPVIINKGFNQQTSDDGSQPSSISKYIINFAIASIKHNLEMQFMETDPYLQEEGLPDGASILPVQTSFLILSIYSYCLDSFPKEIESLRVIICNDRLHSLPPLERARIYTFLAYNYDEIFGGKQLLHHQSLNHWIEFALKQDNHPTVSYCALDFVTNSLHKIYNQHTITKIIQKITTNRSTNFWILVKKMVTLFMNKISEQLYIALIQESYKRIYTEIENQVKKKLKITHVITSLLHVFRVICERGSAFKKMPDLKSLIWQVHRLLPTAQANYFQDEVVKIINCFLFNATTQEIEHQEMHHLLPVFMEDFVKSQYEPTHFYIAFNNFLMKGNLESTIVPIFNLMKEGLKFFLLGKNGVKNETNRKKLPIAHTLLLLQNILALYGSDLPQKQLEQLCELAHQLYPKKMNKKSDQKPKLLIYDRSLLARALNLQFLCYMYHKNPSTIRSLLKYHDLKIYYGYDVSVLLSCLKLQIFKQKQMTTLIELLHICVRVIYVYIEMDTEHKIEKVNEYEKKVKGDDDSQQEYKIDEEENEEQMKKKSALMIRIKRSSDYEAILAHIHTPFLNTEPKILSLTKNVKQIKDIRKEFTELLHHLRISNPALFESIVTGFSESIKHKLQVVVELKIDTILNGELLPGINEGKRKIYKVKKIKPLFEDEKRNQEDEDWVQEKNRRQEARDEGNDSNDEQNLKSQKTRKKKQAKQKMI